MCFSPGLFPEILTTGDFLVVLTDILRATTSICTAFGNGVKEIIPVPDHESALTLKKKGYLVAAEQDGKKLQFADFGNSAFQFTPEAIAGRSLVYCTTNGTKALRSTQHIPLVAIGAFINITALTGWLNAQHRDTVILCSGWKNKFCLEDSLFAGALAGRLLEGGLYETICDSALAAIDLWNIARRDPVTYIRKAMHRKRLQKLGLDDVIPYTFTPDLTTAVPVFSNGVITDYGKNHQK